MTEPNSGFSVLRAGIPAERAQWLSLWEQSPSRLPFSHPDLAVLLSGGEEEVLAATLNGPTGTVLYAFVRRPLPGDRCDLSSPYGYGGALYWGAPDAAALAGEFWGAFDDWSRGVGVVSEFVRASLFDDVLAHPGTATPRNENFVRELEPVLDALWAGSSAKVRRNVRKAIRAGLSVRIDRRGELIDDFHRIYTRTMVRHDSSPWYRFPREFFTHLQQALGEDVVYAAVYDETGRIVSIDLTLLGGDTAYYFLGGTDLEHAGSRPNDLVKTTVMDWLALSGHRSYVLGGGLSAGDGLERYKRGFAPHGARTFTTIERIHDPAACARLVRDRRAEAVAAGLQWPENSDFFPAYRVPLPEDDASAETETDLIRERQGA